MFEGLLMLLTLSTLMAIASFLAGSLPLSFSLSPSRLKIVTTLGMGVLVGTSLIVIIPEGAQTLYSANEVSVSNRRRTLDGRSTLSSLALPGHDAPRISLRDEKSEVEAINALPGPVLPGSIAIDPDKDDPPKTPTEPGVVGALDFESPPSSSSSTEEPADPATHHAWMGIALIGGFILMYLIDTLPFIKPQAAPRGQNIYSLSDLGSTPVATPSAGTTPHSSFSTTLGLVIHAAADGIALGASTTQPALSFIIFFAIMVHKAPAAFGLTSVLLKQGLSKRQARTHLVMFSLAAPAGAFVSWLLIGMLGGGGQSTAAAQATKWWTGVILLFSGGTFLYVAMHTMQDEQSSGGGEENQPNGYLDVPTHRERHAPKKSLRLVFVAVAGMLLPLVTQVWHAG